ncbi:MAG: thioredoxin domain-containing protein [Chloroflexi bacterium]|nr:thioredoxin domain-containing protein [Chloroflexota bacterium]
MAGIAVAVLVGALLLTLWTPPATPAATIVPLGTDPAPASGAPRLIRADSPTLGPVDARVTLVEFLDPECEACRAFHPVVKDLLATYPDDLRLVVRYVPGHANSALAVVALEAAGEQGRYWEMMDALFAAQPEWGEQQTSQAEAFIDIARSLDLDMEPFIAALERADVSSVQRDLVDVRAFGVRATPTFFIDGQQLDTTSEASLRDALATAIERRSDGS